MIRNKGKPGKKVKKEVSKPEPTVQAYDLDVISKDDLKKYIALLEKELEKMRKDCAFYALNKDKIRDFLEARREAYQSEKKFSLVRNSEMYDLQDKIRNDPVKDNAIHVIKNGEKISQRQQKVFQDFIARCSVESKHLDEKHKLKKQIAERDQLLQWNPFMRKTILIDQKEAFLSAHESLDLNCKSKLESALLEYVARSVKANLDFNSEKLRTFISVWDIKNPMLRSEKESFIEEVNRMQDFFVELSSNNAEVIKILRENLSKLKEENKKLEFHLKKTSQENLELKDRQLYVDFFVPGKQKRVSEKLKMAKTEKHLAKLQFKNDVLTEKLKIEKEDLQMVKKQFVAATRQIRQKADFKTYLIEEMLRITMQGKAKESENIITKCRSAKIKTTQRDKSESNKLNAFKMKVEDSNTLFVPPVYPEYWHRFGQKT